MTTTPHYCKWCGATFLIRVPITYTGDGIVKCKCGARHPRQFEAGIAVSCNPPTGKHIIIEEYRRGPN